MNLSRITDGIFASGILGVFAFGVVDVLKDINWIGSRGFGVIQKRLGPGGLEALRSLFYEEGGTSEELVRLLKSIYRRSTPELSQMLKDGLRQAHANAKHVSSLNKTFGPNFEVALNPKIDEAITVASKRYKLTMKGLAFLVATAASFAVLWMLGSFTRDHVTEAAIVAFAAVPIAPIANDLVALINANRRG